MNGMRQKLQFDQAWAAGILSLDSVQCSVRVFCKINNIIFVWDFDVVILNQTILMPVIWCWWLGEKGQRRQKTKHPVGLKASSNIRTPRMCTIGLSQSAPFCLLSTVLWITGFVRSQYLDEPGLEVTIHNDVVSVALVAMAVRYHHRRYRL